MEINSYKLSIAELESILAVVNTRLEQLRGESGDDNFEARLNSAVDELRALIIDRCENEDVDTLWKIVYDLRALLSRIMNKLSGLSDE